MNSMKYVNSIRKCVIVSSFNEKIGKMSDCSSSEDEETWNSSGFEPLRNAIAFGWTEGKFFIAPNCFHL